MHVVQQVDVEAEFLAQPLEHRRNEVDIAIGAPDALERPALFGRLVRQLAAADAVRVQHARNGTLRPNGAVTQVCIMRNRLHRLLNGAAVGMTVDENRIA